MAFSLEIRRRIIDDNLHIQEREIAKELEARRSHLADVADVLMNTYVSGDTFVSDDLYRMKDDRIFSEENTFVLHRELREENRHTISNALQMIRFYDEAVLAEILVRRIRKRNETFSYRQLVSMETKTGKISYVRNAYTDEAWDIFSMSFDRASVVFAETYEEACAEVLNENANYCILPFRDTNGDYHKASLSMLDIHALSVADVVTVTDGEDAPMQFALCGKHPIQLPADYKLLLSLPDRWMIQMDEVTYVMSHFNMQITEFTTRHNSRDIIFTLHGTQDPTAFFVWLELFAAGYQIIGIYSDTEE